MIANATTIHQRSHEVDLSMYRQPQILTVQSAITGPDMNNLKQFDRENYWPYL